MCVLLPPVFAASHWNGTWPASWAGNETAEPSVFEARTMYRQCFYVLTVLFRSMQCTGSVGRQRTWQACCNVCNCVCRLAPLLIAPAVHAG